MWEAAEHSVGDKRDFQTSVTACKYLAAYLGYTLIRSPREAARDPVLSDQRWCWLSTRRQQDAFLWCTDIHEDIWNDLLWQECLEMRYDRGDRKALTYLTPTVRRDLEEEARQLKQLAEGRKVSYEQLEGAAAKIGRGRFMGVAHQILRTEYLRASVEDVLGPDHWLHQPISRSGFFARIAEPGPEHSKMSQALRESFDTRFCRYLCASPCDADALMGEVLLYLKRIETVYWQTRPEQLPNLPGVRWPAQLPSHEESPTQDFRRIVDCYTRKTNICKSVFSQIWDAHVTLTTRRIWEKRAGVNQTVYWAARILEGLRPDVYRLYGQWIDYFHVDILKPFMRVNNKDRSDMATQRAALDPFLYALSRDPLLNCVFHSEVLGGRDRLFSGTGYKRRDSATHSQMIVCTVQLLRSAHRGRFARPVQRVLTEDIELQQHVRQAACPSTRDQRIGGYSLYAYAAPLVAAVVDDRHWPLTADNVKEIYNRHKDDPEIKQLLRTYLPDETR